MNAKTPEQLADFVDHADSVIEVLDEAPTAPIDGLTKSASGCEAVYSEMVDRVVEFHDLPDNALEQERPVFAEYVDRVLEFDDRPTSGVLPRMDVNALGLPAVHPAPDA